MTKQHMKYLIIVETISVTLAVMIVKKQ